MPPEFQAALRWTFKADAVNGGNVDTVCDGVGTLDGLPRAKLRGAILRLLRRMPADGCWVEQNISAAQRRDACGLRIPLVPTNQHADAAMLRIEIAEANIARGEIEFFEEKGIIRDVHLAIDAQQFAPRVDDGGGVVIEPGSAPFKQAGHNSHIAFFGDFA